DVIVGCGLLRLTTVGPDAWPMDKFTLARLMSIAPVAIEKSMRPLIVPLAIEVKSALAGLSKFQRLVGLFHGRAGSRFGGPTTLPNDVVDPTPSRTFPSYSAPVRAVWAC